MKDLLKAVPERVVLGKSGLEVSPICYGTWQISPETWGDLPEKEMIDSIRHAFDLNINFFDTADIYGFGYSEEVLGRAVAGLPRDQIVIATKPYFQWDADRKMIPNMSPEHLRRACNASLKRLGTDYIDLYLCHGYEELADIEELSATLDSLVKEGKIRQYGFSNWNADQIDLGTVYGEFSVLQPPYNLLRRGAEKDLFPTCRRHNIGVMVYGSLNKGLLTGKFNGDEEFDDLRAKYPEFQGEKFQQICDKVSQLREFAKKYDMTVTQLVITCSLMHPVINCAIVGIKNRRQIEEAAAVTGKAVTREDWYDIRAITNVNL